jgi:predicted lipoprotein with Yx(FWY)xxD motif
MRFALVLLPLAVGLTLAACGSGGGYTSAGQPVSAAAAATKHAKVDTRRGALGTYLVDARGRTLYLFEKDTGRKSTCSGACATVWPPLITKERPEAEGGAKASKLSTSRRADGTRQVVYNGHPLYHFSADTKAGQTSGQGISAFGARWYVVAPSGKAITASAARATPAPYTY